MRSAVRVVFNTLNRRRNTVFHALEIDNTIMMLVATTDVARCNAAQIVTPTCLRLLLEKRRIRTALVQLVVHHSYVVTTAC